MPSSRIHVSRWKPSWGPSWGCHSLPRPTRLALFAALLGAALGAGCRGRDSSASVATAAAPPVEVAVARPSRRDIIRRLTVAATLEPWESATLFAKVSGYVRQIRVDRGDRVKKGQLIAVLDVPEADTEVARALAEERQVKAAVEQARSEVRLQEVTSRRLAAIRAEDRGAASQQEIDVAHGKADVARAALATAEGRLAVLAAEVTRLRTLGDYRRVVAPFDGVVSERFVDSGALVAAGTAGKPSAIAMVVNPARLRVVVDVPETDVSFVAVGNWAEVEVAALGGRRFDGTIARRSEALDPASRTMRVEVEIDNRERILIPGMFGKAKLNLETRRGVLSVEPLWLKMQKDQPYLFVARDAVARRLDVKTGADDGKFVEVVQGLGDEDAIIVASKQPLVDGIPIVVGRPQGAP